MNRFGTFLVIGTLIAAPFAATKPAAAQVYVGVAPAYPYACSYYTPYYCNYGWASRPYRYGWSGWGYGYPYGVGWGWRGGYGGRHGGWHGGYHGGGHHHR